MYSHIISHAAFHGGFREINFIQTIWNRRHYYKRAMLLGQSEIWRDMKEDKAKDLL